MRSDTGILKEKLKRWTLILGVFQVTMGCIIGLIPPSAVEWFRGIVMAHIEFTANGILMIVFAFLVKELSLKPRLLKVWFWALQIGTWTNGTAGVVAAITGSSSKLLPTLSEKFPPPYGMDNVMVTNLLHICGVSIIATLLLTLYGLLRSKAPTEGE